MLLGDFSGHNILWGSKDNDPRGDLIEDFITQNDICLMNDISNTFLDSGKGTFSALDLSICHPSLYLDYEWSVCEDQHGSDHFPIVIESIKLLKRIIIQSGNSTKPTGIYFILYAMNP